MKSSKKYRDWTLIAILILAFVVRFPGLFLVANLDEYAWLSIGSWKDWHPPLSILAHTFFSSILGQEVWVSRFLMILLGLINLVLAYLIAKELYSKKAAVITSMIMAFLAYPILASLQIDIDGSFLLLFYSMSSLFLIKSLKTDKWIWLIPVGISFGLGLLSKYSGLFIFPVLVLYYLIKTRNVWKTTKSLSLILIIGALVFSLFPLISSLHGDGSFPATLAHLLKYASPRETNIVMLLIQYLLFFLWLGPLLLALFFLSIQRKEKRDTLPLIWVAVIFLVYLLLNKDNYKPIERYFTVLITPLALLAGNYLSNIRFQTKHKIACALLSLIFLISFISINKGGDIINFYPKQAFLDRALSFDWNFYVPITGSSGPVGFYLNFLIIAISFISAGLFLVLSLISIPLKKEHLLKWAIVCLISISLAYNIMFTQEFLLGSTAPNINKINQEIIYYAQANELKPPIYIFRNYASGFYLASRYSGLNYLDFDIESDAPHISKVTNGSTVLIVDFPQLNKESQFWNSLEVCNLEKTFADKGRVLGYVYTCPSS